MTRVHYKDRLKHCLSSVILGLRTCIFLVRPINSIGPRRGIHRLLASAPYFDQPFYVGFQVGGFELGLDPNGGEPGAGGTVVYWGTVDIVAEIERLVSLGAKVVNPIQEVGEGIKVAVVEDPFGNRFGVIQNPQFDRQAVR